jgi:hypothetical protein
MTKEEALGYFERRKKIFGYELSDKVQEAEDKAIKALRQEFALEKAKDEITKLQTYKIFIGEEETYVERDNVLAIIDKYIVESEPNGKDE